MDAQIVYPSRVRWCPALRPDEDVAIAVLSAHQWCLTDCTGLVTCMDNDDHRQPCIIAARLGISEKTRGMPASGSRARGVHVCFAAWSDIEERSSQQTARVRLYRTGLIPFQTGSLHRNTDIENCRTETGARKWPVTAKSSERLADISLTLGNVASIFAARTWPTETGLAGIANGVFRRCHRR